MVREVVAKFQSLKVLGIFNSALITLISLFTIRDNKSLPSSVHCNGISSDD